MSLFRTLECALCQFAAHSMYYLVVMKMRISIVQVCHHPIVRPIRTIVLKNDVLGAVSPLSHATTDHCALHCILSMYSSGSYLSLQVVYVLSLGLAMTSVFHFSLSHLNRQHECIFLNCSATRAGDCTQPKTSHLRYMYPISFMFFLSFFLTFHQYPSANSVFPFFVICNTKMTISATDVFAWCLLQLVPGGVFSPLPRKICKFHLKPFPSQLSSSTVTVLELHSQAWVPPGNQGII